MTRTTRTSYNPIRAARRYGVRASIVTLFLAMGLAGVGPLPRATAAPSPQTLRIWYGSDDPTEQAWAQTIVAAFATAHPTIHVQFSFYDLDDMNDKTQLALSSNTAPDLIYSPPRGPGLPAYVRANQLRDLSAAAQAHQWAQQLRPGLLASYNQTLAANGGPAAAGKIFAVPDLLAADGILYNKDIFRHLGLAVPTTEAQFAALLPRIKAAGDVPLGFGNEDAWSGDAWYLTLVNAQVGLAALRPALQLASSFRFTTPPFVQAAATLQDWIKAGYMSKGFGGLDPQDAVENFFEEGQTAMQLVSSTEYSQILQESRSDESTVKDVGLFAFPSAHPQERPVMLQDGYSGWAIPKGAHNSAAALTFINYALSAQTATTLLAHGLLPARRVGMTVSTAAPFQRDALAALDSTAPGVYVDAAPIPDFLATMEAQIEQVLAGKETPAQLTRSLQAVYASRGQNTPYSDTDGEF